MHIKLPDDTQDRREEHGLLAQDFEGYIGRLPAPWPEVGLSEKTRQDIRAEGAKLVAIDDDPTGCQTVHDVPLLLEWSVEGLQAGLMDPAPALFVLSNTRAMTREEAYRVNREIAGNLLEAAKRCGQRFCVLSRSDSTLRGHYPAETDVLQKLLGPYDGLILAPCFFEGGRFTGEGVHWVKQDSRLVPVAQTEFAGDATFGFSHSYLPAWVEEKTAGAIPSEGVMVVSLEDIRRGGPEKVSDKLMTARQGAPIAVDAFEYGDLDVFVSGLLGAEEAGRRYLYRSGASFLRVRAGIGARPLLEGRELVSWRLPGLVAVGSYVPRSTAQLKELLSVDRDAGVELEARALLIPGRREEVIEAAVLRACRLYDQGKAPVIFTSRELLRGKGPEESLRLTTIVSAAMVETVRALVTRRRFGFLIAKGGITSHELAMKALDARRTRVLGQISPGVPVWRLGEESLAPGMTYVVFPGNVGDAGTLRHVVELLSAGERERQVE